jgi:hypothetical protein
MSSQTAATVHHLLMMIFWFSAWTMLLHAALNIGQQRPNFQPA